MDKKDKTRIIVSIILIATVILVVFGISFAIFSYQKPGSKRNVFTTGTLKLVLDESMGNSINLENAVPTSDAVGKNQTPYRFTLKNTGTLGSRYRIRLVPDEQTITADNCGDKQLDYNLVKYNLVKDDVEVNTALLSTLNNNVIDLGVLQPNQLNSYELRLWLNQSITNSNVISGKHLHVKVVVEAIQATGTDFEDYIKDNLMTYYDATNHGIDNNIWKDLSGNGHDGTLVSINQTATSGWQNNNLALDYNLNNYVETKSIKTIPESFTISILLNIKDYRDKTYNGISIVSTRTGGFIDVSGTGFDVFMNASNKKVGLIVSDGTNVSYASGYGIPGNYSVDFNKTNEITLVKTPNKEILYLNGKEVASHDFTKPIGAATVDAMWINSRSAASRGYMISGNIYNYLFYGKALSASEVNHNWAVNKSKFGL